MILKHFSIFNASRFYTLVFSLLTALMVSGCGDGAPEDLDLDSIDLKLSVQRLDKDMTEAAKMYSGGQRADSLQVAQKFFVQHRAFIADWMFMSNDSMTTDSVIAVVMGEFLGNEQGRALLDSVNLMLGEGFDPEKDLTPLFKRYKYHFPDRPTPVVVTFVDGFPPTAQQGLDQIFISPRFLGIGVHYFLGPSFKFYPPDLPKYIRRRCTPEHLSSLVAHKIAELSVPEPDLVKNPVLIDFVVAEGLRMHMIDKLLGPQVHDSLKLYYTASQMEWADYYEGRAFKDMIPDLYTTESDLMRRYLDDSPFTSQLNRESAPRLGQYIGWKIVQKFAKENPEIPLRDLIKRTDYQTIFKAANYRPEPRE